VRSFEGCKSQGEVRAEARVSEIGVVDHQVEEPMLVTEHVRNYREKEAYQKTKPSPANNDVLKVYS
jgi:hypothetical protein